MTPSLKRKITALLFIALFLSGCAQQKSPEAEKTYLPKVTALTLKSGLEHEFTVTGEVFAHQTSRITSEIRGKVESISVHIGDFVSLNAPLMRLSSSEIASNFNTASSTLKNAQVGLESTKLSSEKNVEAAEIGLETSKTNLQNIIRQNRNLRAQAEENLKAAELNVSLSVNAAKTNLDNAIKNVLSAIQTAITASDKILGVSEVYKFTNDSFENNLGALNSRTKYEAEHALRDVLNQLNSYSPSFENALSLLILTEDALQKTVTVLNNSISGSNYLQTTLTNDVNSITIQISAIRGVISALENAKNALDTAEQESDGHSQSILNARAAYNATIEQLEANERTARKTVESAENALENAKRSAQLTQVSAKTSVDSAYGNYDQARISKDKLNIVAPFKGKVVDIYVKTGEEINPGTPLIIIEDDSQLNLVAYLSSDDAEKIHTGETALINQNGETALISSIAPSPDPVTKKYKVELLHSHSSLRPGELIKLTFKTGEKIFNGHRIFVPLPALHILPNEVFVWKLIDRKTVRAPITVGEIVGDYAEVLDGLKIGDEIINEGGRLIEEGGVKVDILNKPTPKVPSS